MQKALSATSGFSVLVSDKLVSALLSKVMLFMYMPTLSGTPLAAVILYSSSFLTLNYVENGLSSLLNVSEKYLKSSYPI